MTDNSELIAEARKHIEHLVHGIPGGQADRVRRGESSDPRVSLVVRLADALEVATRGEGSGKLPAKLAPVADDRERQGSASR